MAGYLAKKGLSGEKKYPLVMMLEPLHACNLTCTGCGRIREYKSTINEMLTVEQCLSAVDDCGAPIVSICGGEPMIYPEIGRLAGEILARKKHIYLCTNGMFIRKRLAEFKPTSRLVLQRAPRRAGEDARHLRRARRRVPRSHRRNQGGEGGGIPGHLQHHDLQGNGHRGNRRAVRLPADAGRRWPHDFAGLFLRRRDDQGNLHVARRKSAKNSGRRARCSSATTS